MNNIETHQVTARFSWIIYAWLIVLTIVEVAVALLEVPKAPGAIVMAATTLGKSLLILLYFMHLKFDRRVVWLLPGIPLLLAVLFVIALFPDIVFKSVLLH